MTEAGTVFTTVSVMMLANGGVFAVVSRDLPAALRPAAAYWQLGTMLIAAGCAVFAFGAPLPRPLMLFAANGLMAFGLTAYYAAVQRYDGIRPRRWQLLPAAVSTAGVLWFSAITPDFRIRVAIVSAAWLWLMAASVATLVRRSRGDVSLSRRILAGLFAAVMVYLLARLVIYLLMGLDAGFAVESGANWLNMLSPVVMTVLPVVGTTAFLLMCSDSLRRQLEAAASTDYLTGLPNRRSLARHGRRSFREAEDRGAGFAVAILDIDHFKAINDSHGHDAGDQVLVDVAGHLHEQAGHAGMVARSGGEEFVVLLESPHHIAATDIVERMRLAIERARFSAGPARIPVTLSAGVALYRPADRSFEDTLRRADQALYAAKTGGRNRVETARFAVVPAKTASTGDGTPSRHMPAAEIPSARPARRVG